MNMWLAVRGMGSCEAAHAADLGALLPPLLAEYYGTDTAPPLRRVPRYARMGLWAALRALNEAGWKKGEDSAAMACLIGSAFGSVEMSMDYMDSLLDAGPRLSSPTAFSHAVNNMGAGLLSLLLQSRGACQTVAQFELSFAAALTAATLELAQGRAERVLVGALEETDPRFVQSCPEVALASNVPPVPPSKVPAVSQEGAYFLCLERALPHAQGPKIRVRWTHNSPPAATTAETCILPLAQPAAVFIALQNQQSALCPARDSVYGHAAIVEVSHAPLES